MDRLYHKKALERMCIECVDNSSPRPRRKTHIKFNVLLKREAINVEDDDEAVHPILFCHNCYKLHHFKSKVPKGRLYEEQDTKKKKTRSSQQWPNTCVYSSLAGQNFTSGARLYCMLVIVSLTITTSPQIPIDLYTSSETPELRNFLYSIKKGEILIIITCTNI